MSFEREKKISKLLLHTKRIHKTYREPCLKVPIELCQFALSEKKVREIQIYLTGLYLYSGKASAKPNTYSSIGGLCGASERTVYAKMKWLIERNWIGKDDKKGWIFFRSLNRVHQIESWKYSRSALFQEKDIQSIKGFFIGAVLSSIVYTGNKGNGTDRQSKRSGPARYPVSISALEQVLNVSNKTAYNYRKLAEKYRYIKMLPHLRQVTGITAKDIRHLKQNHIEKVVLPLFGSCDSITVHPNQLRNDKGWIYAQLSNFIYPHVLITKRKLRST